MRLPGGRRVQGAFSSDTSLMGLLQFWVGSGELDAGVGVLRSATVRQLHASCLLWSFSLAVFAYYSTVEILFCMG